MARRSYFNDEDMNNAINNCKENPEIAIVTIAKLYNVSYDSLLRRVNGIVAENA
jgi:hypothetical protein